MAKGANQNLNQAKVAKKDEFYTQLTDIEKELAHYYDYFEGKVVYCNCDDPKVSNFFLYFARNFWHLKLKKLICSCYKNKKPDFFSDGTGERGCFYEYNGVDENGKELREISEITKFIPTIKSEEFKKGDGDFRSEESIALLKKADIVVTNPPFSLFREFVAQLMEYDKKFVIIGNQNAITYKEIFKLIKENKIWLGASIHSGDREFGVPEHYPLAAAGIRVDDVGNKFIRVKGVRWFVNLDYPKRHEILETAYSYVRTPEHYPKYDNYDAINVNKTAEIPLDYDGLMGVPITFLDKYNPTQFKLIGIDRYVEDNPNPGKRFTIQGKETYARILLKKIKD